MNRPICFLILSLFVAFFSNASISRHEVGSGEVSVSKFEVLDLVLRSAEALQDPFELDLGADFVSPTGEKLSLNGFYNDDNEWIVRFSANEEGSWSFETYSAHAAFAGLGGSIDVGPAAADRHGAIVIAENDSRKFAYEDGTSYFMNGFECDWLFALDGENPEGAPKTEHLLSLLEDYGFNQVVTTVYSHSVRWEIDPKLSMYPEHDYGDRETMFPFGGSNSDPDFSTLNVDFFKRFDRVVALMDEKGIVAHLMIYVFNKNVNWAEASSDADNRYFDYVLNRYGAFSNVVWDIAKEIFRRSESYALDRLERFETLNPFDRLVTVHDKHFAEKYPEKLDFFARQDWRGDLYSEMLSLYRRFEKPVVNVEHGGYEESYYEVFPGDYTNPEVCLRRAYMCYFAGVYSAYYWQGAAWNVIIYNPFEQASKFPKPKFEYYKHLAEFFERYDYNNLSPYKDHTLSAYGLRSSDGVFLYYVPQENYQLSNYDKSLWNKQGTYQWFNTRTGEYSQEMPYEGGHYVSPWRGEADSILIRNAKSK